MTGPRPAPTSLPDEQRGHPGLIIPLSLAAWMAIVLVIALIARCF